MEKVEDETKASFQAVAGMRCDIVSGLEPHERILWMNSEETDSIFLNGKGWEDIPRKYPNVMAYAVLSPLGFNKAHDHALVYVAYSCGGLCRRGHLVLFEKKDGRWQVLRTVELWIS